MQHPKFLTLLFSAILMLLSSPDLRAQSAEFEQLLSAFQGELQAQYEFSTLNVSQPEVGDIENTEYLWKKEYQLKSHEKKNNNLNRKMYEKLYLGIYGYDSPTDRQYALQYWMKNFIEGESIRRRDLRSYDDATPTIIIIRPTEIVILNYYCRDYSYRQFDDWADRMYQYFGGEGIMMLEVACDGPLKWTRNAPDPKGRDLF